MNVQLPLLGLAIVIALVIGIVFWFLAASRTGGTRREERHTRRIAQQPWDAQSADGRGNR